MAGNIDQDLLDEIRYDIKVKDMLKGQLVFAALEYVKWDTQKKALLEVARAEEDFAVPLLVGVFVNSPDIADSFPHLKETMYSKVLGRPEVLLDMLTKDDDAKTKAFLAQMAGEIRLKPALPVLMDLISHTTDVQVLQAAIFALGMIGEAQAVVSIGDLLQAEVPEVVAAAVDALGQLADAKAMRLLWECLGKDPDTDRRIIDIFATAQTPEALEMLNATLASKHAHIRTTGKQKLSEIGVMSIRVLAKNLTSKDSDLVVHSLNVLGDIGDPAAISCIRNLLHNHPDDPNIRFAAYETLGRFAEGKGAFTLAAGLEDPVDHVRLAAAKAIDRNYNALLAGGVRNLTGTNGEGAIKIIETVVEAQCENIFLDLLEEDYFQSPAMDFIIHKAHPQIKAYYLNTLNAKGYVDLAQQINLDKPVKEKPRFRIFVVDDSKMMLNIYRTVLHNLKFDSLTFEFPKDVLAKIQEDKPDALITDLNMPDITGIELAAGIRKTYTKEELPIIMITTQDEIADNEDAISSGINGILRKPFTESQIGYALKMHAGLVTDA